jgi:hypothetical protein
MGIHKKHKIRATSLESFGFILENIGERQMQVFKAIKLIEPCSDMMLSKFLKSPVNQITARRNELFNFGLITLEKVDICPYTKRRVRYYRIKKWLREVMN